jgi:hypothetical protein
MKSEIDSQLHGFGFLLDSNNAGKPSMWLFYQQKFAKEE